VDDRAFWVFGGWLISTGAAVAVSGAGPVGRLITGLVFVCWGVLIGLNYRGLAEAMPSRMFWTDVSVARHRLGFALFGIVGLVVSIFSVADLIT
jgi:hypothetical protein